MLPDFVVKQSGQSTKEEACLHHDVSTHSAGRQAGLGASSPHREGHRPLK